MKKFLQEAALGLFFAIVIVIAQYATTFSDATFVYQGF